MRERLTTKRSALYVKPLTELVFVQSEGLLNPHSWNDGQGGPNMSIYEEDPNGDGKGAKGSVIWVNDHDGGSGLWDD